MGGYWAPTLIRGRREVGTVTTNTTAHGDADVEICDFNILDYPLVEYKDIVVDLMFAITVTRFNAHTVRS